MNWVNCNALKCIGDYDSFNYIITYEDYGEELELKEYNSEEIHTYHKCYVQDIKPIPTFKENNGKESEFEMYFNKYDWYKDEEKYKYNRMYVYTDNDKCGYYVGTCVTIFKYYVDCNISAYDSQFFIESIYGNIIEYNLARRNTNSMIEMHFVSYPNIYNIPPVYPSSSYYWNNEPFNLLGSRSNGWNYSCWNPYRSTDPFNSDLFNDFLKWK